MSFVQFEYLPFFLLVFAINWVLPGPRAKNVFLLVASYIFYGWIHPWMTVLLFGITGMNFLAGQAIVRWPGQKDRFVGAVIALSIANLCLFKYFGFFSGEILPRFVDAESASSVAAWNLVLPLGLSFYTFHNLSYTIEVYRERFPVKRNFVDYFLYGSFFPQLVAGPIERASNVMPQLERDRRFDGSQVASGLGLFLWGAFKKVALADAIAPYTDMMFLAEDPNAAMVWTGALGFTIQALADFSGYTDMARGSSRMLGIELMDNFAHPYLAASPMEFWQRWHISFSTWLRDYIYVPACFSDWVRRYVRIPFTGEWGPFATTSRALLLTMLVSGIWHGSTWNYIVWGLYYFVIGTVYAGLQPRLPKKWRKDARWRYLMVPIMFGFTVFGMYIFREPSIPRLASRLLLSPFAGTPEQWTVSLAMVGVCAYASLPLLAGLAYERYVRDRVVGTAAWPVLQTATWAVLAIAALSSVRMTETDFIYFQF